MKPLVGGVRFSVILPRHIHIALARRANKASVSRASVARWALSDYLGLPLDEATGRTSAQHCGQLVSARGHAEPGAA